MSTVNAIGIIYGPQQKLRGRVTSFSSIKPMADDAKDSVVPEVISKKDIFAAILARVVLPVTVRIGIARNLFDIG